MEGPCCGPGIQHAGMDFSLLFFLSLLCHSSAGLGIVELSAEAGGNFFCPKWLVLLLLLLSDLPRFLVPGEHFWDGSGGVTLFLAKEMKTLCKSPGTLCGCRALLGCIS